ncbi:uncharacterized protein LOC123290369 [Chrysoperla carnea]|uniref:uncharacterized protein LOC123290369 n=1 Tax=Chrysoperla carnea TaxID=189513 RepID=UPI001D0992F0|nr:uncharacterized protein LOC123290369 [Chrysoperla carnea]
MSDSAAERAVISILVPIVVARAIYLTNEEDAQKWLHSLKNVPKWAQTKDLFNIGWITCYAASGLASALIFNASVEKHVTKNPALLAYLAQLGLCWLYTIAIYGLQSLDLGLAVLLLLDGIALVATISFLKISTVAALLNGPIVLWLFLITSLLFSCRKSNSVALVGGDDKLSIMEKI